MPFSRDSKAYKKEWELLCLWLLLDGKSYPSFIHNNPVKASLTTIPEEYKWSSCQIYYRGQDFLDLVNTSFILGVLDCNRDVAIRQFIDFMKTSNTDQFMEFTVKRQKSDEDLAQEIKEMLNGQPVSILQNIDIDQRNKIIGQIKRIEGVTQRQIARVTGIHQSIIFKV